MMQQYTVTLEDSDTPSVVLWHWIAGVVGDTAIALLSST